LVYPTSIKDGAILIHMTFKSKTIHQLILMLSISIFSNTVFADRIKDFTDVAGQRPNQLVGYGLVVGLDGTGDQTTQTPFTLQSVLQMIGVLGVTLPSTGTQAQLRNTAAVMVTAEFPALAKPGQQIDITVSSLGNATSFKRWHLSNDPIKSGRRSSLCSSSG